MTKFIDDALGLRTLPAVIDDEETLPVVVSQDAEQVAEDTNTSRDNILSAAALAQQAVQDMLSIAQQSQHPKAYEVLNSLIKTFADVSMGLTDLQIKKQKLVQSDTPDGEGPVTNNLFVGSTAELQKLLEELKKKKSSDE